MNHTPTKPRRQRKRRPPRTRTFPNVSASVSKVLLKLIDHEPDETADRLLIGEACQRGDDLERCLRILTNWRAWYRRSKGAA